MIFLRTSHSRNQNLLKILSGKIMFLKLFFTNLQQEIFQKFSLYMSSNLLYCGVLVHQDSADQAIDLIVDLYEDRMVAYLDKKKTNVFGVIGLTNSVQLEFTDLENTDEDEIQFLFFQKKSRTTVLFCELETEFEKWIKMLKPICLLANFSQFYTFEKVIGKGTFAKVVLCSRNTDKQKFAVKVFDKATLLKSKDSQQQITAIENEINVMRQISHPNIIKLYEVYEGGKHVYLVLELLTGGELFKRIYDEENFSENIVLSLMRNLLQALEYLHAKSIMHRDIKPENIIIRDKNGSMGDIILADFGLSEYTAKQNFLFKRFILHIINNRCGTPGYVAPEILCNEPYGTQVDVFSAGVIMYILLTGCSPFYGESYMTILNKNKEAIIDFNFEKLGCKISKNSADLMQMMLKKNPKERITISKALQHPWFKEKSESLTTKIHHQTMEKLLKHQQLLMKTTKPQNMNASQNVISNSPLLNGNMSQQNSSKNSPTGSMLSPSQFISPVVERKSKFAEMKQK